MGTSPSSDSKSSSKSLKSKSLKSLKSLKKSTSIGFTLNQHPNPNPNQNPNVNNINIINNNNDNNDNTGNQERENVFPQKLLKFLSTDEGWLRDGNIDISTNINIIDEIVDKDHANHVELNQTHFSDKGLAEFNTLVFQLTDRDEFYRTFFAGDANANAPNQYFSREAMETTLQQYFSNDDEKAALSTNNNIDDNEVKTAEAEMDTKQEQEQELQQQQKLVAFEAFVDEAYLKQRQQMSAETLPVRLRLTELESNFRLGAFCVIGHFFGAVAQYMNLANGQYGTAHAALTIGSFIVEWGTNEIVIPGAYVDSTLLLCEIDVSRDTPWYKVIIQNGIVGALGALAGGLAAIGVGLQGGGMTDALEAFRAIWSRIWSAFSASMVEIVDIRRDCLLSLAQLCCDWNKYAAYGNTDANKVNCQNFVDEALKVLGIDIEFEGQLKQFLDDVRRTGSTQMKWNGTLIANRRQLDNIIRDQWGRCSRCDQQLLTSYASMMEIRRRLAIGQPDNEQVAKWSTDLTDAFRTRHNIPPIPVHNYN